ncbi:EamA family transporter [Flavobacterium orientale]|uniref:Membrane protein n=1 Tax=Flavobacterium orientale TaxID=1756020 RepID=A0A917DCY9_9FLAO|nr:EamA family transporter [Flavobacterium orientale]GGD29947.1 membrane protein [Flavobacterium orientale]
MIYILCSVGLNSLLFVIFKWFSHFNINTIQALVANYLTAACLGFFISSGTFEVAELPQKTWYWGSFSIGFLFISVFYLIALASQRNGLSATSVAAKMSVVIPIAFGVIIYKESLGFIKIIGIILALAAVYFTSKKEEGQITQNKEWLLPLLVFLGTGAVDTSLKFMQNYYVPLDEIAVFSSHTFFMAFCVGCFFIGYQVVKNKKAIKIKNIMAGIALGIPNYFSLYFMIRMLNHPTWDSSTIFTIHNVAIVTLTTLLGVILFKEKLNVRNTIGILIAIIAIVLVTF